MDNCANAKTSDSATKIDLHEDLKVAVWGVRHKQCMLLFAALLVAYCLQACIGVAVVGMVGNNVTEVNHFTGNETDGANKTDDEDYKADGFLNALMLFPPYPQFIWTKKTQLVVIFSFSLGYLLLQIPAGQLVHRFGSRKMIAAALFINCAASVLFPTVTFYGGWIAAALFRIAQGMSLACIIPACHTFLGRWAPMEERGKLTGIIYGAQALGPAIVVPITASIAASPMGWPGIFRFYAVLSGICGAVIWLFTADSPAQHKSKSAAERNYIEEALMQKGDANKKHLKVPWRRLLCHRGLYAIILADIGQTWSQVTLREVLIFIYFVKGLNIKTNVLLSALPFLVMWLTNFFFSWFYDMLIVKKYMSVTWARKLAQTVGCVALSVGLIVLTFAPPNIYIVKSIMVTLCAFKISCNYGYLVNHIDISPNFAGTMISISNFCANAVGLLAPIVVGNILTVPTSMYVWRNFFLISSGLYFFTNVLYVILGTSEQADWNDPEPRKDAEEAGVSDQET